MSKVRRAERVAAPRARGSLTRGTILEAGLRIARRDDLSKLTMKKLAAELGVTPMAVYRHFRNKAEVVDGILDLFVREAAVTDHEGADHPEDWRNWLFLTFGAMRQALVQTPSVLPFLSTISRLGPAAWATLEETLAVLRGAGLSDQAAVAAFLGMASYTIGAAGMEAAWKQQAMQETVGAEERRRLAQATIELVPRSLCPSTVAVAPHLARAMVEYPFEQGLELMLDSLSRDAGEKRTRHVSGTRAPRR
jgi:AcrR family transcriptional regulator